MAEKNSNFNELETIQSFFKENSTENKDFDLEKLTQFQELLDKFEDPKEFQKILEEIGKFDLINEKTDQKEDTKEFKNKQNLIILRKLIESRAREIIAINSTNNKEKIINLEKSLKESELKTSIIVKKTQSQNSSTEPEKERANPDKQEEYINLDEELVKALLENINISKAKVLITKGAKISQEYQGKSILANAINQGNNQAINLLVNNGAKLQEEDIYKIDPNKLLNFDNSLLKKIGVSSEDKEKIDFLSNVTNSSSKNNSHEFIENRSQISDEKKFTESKINQNQRNLQEIHQKLIENQIKAKETMELMEELHQKSIKFKHATNEGFGSGILGWSNNEENEVQNSYSYYQENIVNDDMNNDKIDINIDKEPEDTNDLSRDLAEAIYNGDNAKAITLISRVPDVNKSGGGSSPLQIALDRGNEFIASYLLVNGANPLFTKDNLERDFSQNINTSNSKNKSENKTINSIIENYTQHVPKPSPKIQSVNLLVEEKQTEQSFVRSLDKS